MRNRFLEILAAIVGVAVVVFLYADRSWWSDSAEMPEQPSSTLEVPAAPETVEPPMESVVSEQTVVPEVPSADPDSSSPDSDSDVEAARVAWEAAKTELAFVEGQLEQLDAVFDAKETEFTELEAAGADAEALEEEMLIFLDGIVDEYDVLETRLAEAEAAELAAAEHLAHLRGDYPDMLESGENGS